jgi:hypothetical protein
MNVEPLLPAEYELIAKFLEGDSRELQLLRYQLDSLRFGSPFYRPRRFLGFRYWPRTVERSAGETRLKVPWGVGGEDWMLGDRRILCSRDVVARLRDETYVRFELRVSNGVLAQLRILGRTTGPGASLEPLAVRTDRLEIADLFFADSDADSGGFARLTERRPGPDPFSAPPLAGEPTAWEAWFASVEHAEVPPPEPGEDEHRLRLPLTVRRARRATESELDSLEEKLGVRLADDVREFWRASNGASFFGWAIRGTYDTYLFDWPNGWRLLLIENVDDSGSILTCEVRPRDGAADREARALRYAPGMAEPTGVWGSLRESLNGLMNEAQSEARSIGEAV